MYLNTYFASWVQLLCATCHQNGSGHKGYLISVIKCFWKFNDVFSDVIIFNLTSNGHLYQHTLSKVFLLWLRLSLLNFRQGNPRS